MAAPKKWGYTRDQQFGPEMMVSWCDGDLTAILAKEVDERLLANAQSRRDMAAYARASFDSSQVEGKDWIADVRSGLVDQCKAIVQDNAL